MIGTLHRRPASHNVSRCPGDSLTPGLTVYPMHTRWFLLSIVVFEISVAQAQPADDQSKRMFGIIPNYRTSPSLVNYKPLTVKQKFKMGSDDAFDRGTFLLAGASAGEAQLTRSNPSFSDGTGAYSHYFATSFADWAIGDYMTESVFPSLLHQDPRYFRKGTGRAVSRLGYAMWQIFWTHTDSGGKTFNFSEIVGNSAAVAISQAYYPENRSAGNAVSKLGIQVGVDMASNIVKEFYPDIMHRLHHKIAEAQAPPGQ